MESETIIEHLEQMQPMNDRILVKRLARPRYGKIILPDNVKVPKGIKGEVIAVGPGKMVESCSGSGKLVRCPVEVKVGDRIVFSPNGCTDWESDGQMYTLIQEADVVGFLDKEARIEAQPTEYNDVVPLS